MPRMTFDIIDYCNFLCPSCYHGIHGGTKERMSLDTCKQILELCEKKLELTSIDPYN